jgi:hypothetical protein
MRATAIAFVAILACAVQAGAAETDDSGAAGGFLTELLRDQRASGVLRSDYYHSSKSLDRETGFLGITAQLKALPVFSDTLDGKVEVRATNFAIGDRGDTNATLLEGYATIHFDKADLRIGKQIVAWGRADGLNPTDNLTPRDFVALLPLEEDQRFGTTAIRLDTFLSRQHTLTVFVTPLFEPSKTPLPTAGRTLIKKSPARTTSNGELGLRLNKIGESLDWSVSYFRGFSLLPNQRLIDIGANGITVEHHYNRITVFGADIARNYGRFGFRGEVAYMDTADDAGTDPGIENPNLYWIAGVDRTFFSNLNVNLQFFQRRIRHHRDPQAIAGTTERRIAIENSILDGQADRITNGITFRISDKWFNDALEAELFAVTNFTRDNSFIRPLLTRAFNDRWKGTIGAELYRGPADTQYGGLKSNRGMFVELRYGF